MLSLTFGERFGGGDGDGEALPPAYNKAGIVVGAGEVCRPVAGLVEVVGLDLQGVKRDGRGRSGKRLHHLNLMWRRPDF